MNHLYKDPTLQFCMAELRTLLERFANGLSMDIITDAIDALADDARRDPDLRHWCSESSAYAKKVRHGFSSLPSVLI